MTFRPILTTHRNPHLHWVGDGFETQGLLPYQTHAHDQSPFLLAGYNPPRFFPATNKPKGIGMHPHRGFETVTVVYQGGLQHGDTMGNRGEIGPGGVQWMTAGSGVQHEEFHSDLVNREGGMLEMVQLWVNLPQAKRMTQPRYQDITADQIPALDLPDGGHLRVIAGSYAGVTAPIETHSELLLLDGSLPKGSAYETEVKTGWTQSLALLSGKALINGETVIEGPETVIFTKDEGRVRIEALEDAKFMVFAGEPLNEPLVMGGPFVAGSEAELRRAYADYRAGMF